MAKNNDLLARLDTWANRVRMNKSAETIESEEKKMQDPPASPGAMAKEKEQDLKTQSPPAGAENTADTVVPMRDDNTVADADPLAETKDKAESTTTEKDTAKEEAKIASDLDGLLDSVASLIQSAEASTKQATQVKKADPTSDEQHTPEKKKDEPDVPEVKPGTGKGEGSAECKEAATKEAAEQDKVVAFLEGMWKQAGQTGEMTQEGLIKVALDRADQDAARLANWMATVTKAAADMMPPGGGDPGEQDAMLQALLAQMGGGAGGDPAAMMGGAGGDPAAMMGGAGGDPAAMMGGMGGAGGSPEDAAAGELSGLPPEALEQVIALLEGAGGGGGGMGGAAPSEEGAPPVEGGSEEQPEGESTDKAEDKETEE